MRLQISSVADKGVADKERIILKVLVDSDIGDFVLLQAGHNENGVTIAVFHTLWFPYKKVSNGDLVVVYTKSGTNSENTIAGGRTAHFFYWGIPTPIWNTKNRAPVLLYAPEWETKAPQEL